MDGQLALCGSGCLPFAGFRDWSVDMPWGTAGAICLDKMASAISTVTLPGHLFDLQAALADQSDKGSGKSDTAIRHDLDLDRRYDRDALRKIVALPILCNGGVGNAISVVEGWAAPGSAVSSMGLAGGCVERVPEYECEFADSRHGTGSRGSGGVVRDQRRRNAW